MSISNQAQNDPKKLVEYLLGDLRNLSTEAKKKHNHVKEASESGIVKIRNISTSSTSETLLQNLRSSCAEVLHPLILGCSSKNPKLVQISLQAIQHMLQYRIVNPSSAPVIVNELWQLTEAECEELRILQTVTPFVSTELLVTDWALAKCIVLAIKLNFSKDPSVINAASAAVRQLFSCVFDRVIQEDQIQPTELKIIYTSNSSSSFTSSSGKNPQSLAPPTLRPAAADAYLLLKDLIILIRKENPVWLNGVKRITNTLALELLEAVLKNYSPIFNNHVEFGELLKNQICPQLVKLFVGEKEIRLSTLSSMSIASDDPNRSFTSDQIPAMMATNSRPLFPIIMRTLRITLVLITHYHSLLALQNEVLITFLLELIQSAEGWQTTMALEVLHKIVVQPNLLYWLCLNFDHQPNSTKLVRLILQRLVAYTKKSLEETAFNNVDTGSSQGEMASQFGQCGFLYKGVFIPLHENLSLKRWILLDWLEKHEPSPIPEGYSFSIVYASLVDCTQSIYAAIETEDFNSAASSTNLSNSVEKEALAKDLFYASYLFLLEGLALLLECSIDESISDSILNCFSTILLLSCKFGHPEPKEATLRTICRAALPQGYFIRYIEIQNPSTLNNNHNINSLQEENKESKDSIPSGGVPSHVVAMGTICPTPSLPASMHNSTVMLTAKNMQVSRFLIACAQSNGQKLTDSWDCVLGVLQHLVWILGMKPTSSGGFRTSGDTTGTSVDTASTTSGTSSAATNFTIILTTAVSSELPDLNLALNRLFESTLNYDDVSLHHVIAALCKLSTEAMMVAQQSSREPSFFAVAKLLQTAAANLTRLEVFWKPVTAHLLEVCAHTNNSLREWGAVALTVLVKNAMKQVSVPELDNSAELVKKELLILTPLASMSEIEFLDVKTKQLDCLMHVLQSDNLQLKAPIWPLIIGIVTTIVDNSVNSALIEQGYQTVNLIVKEFLGILPFECIQILVETDAKYGKQPLDLNVALAAVGQLWDISDYVRRESVNRSVAEVEAVWLVIYSCLGQLCVDLRPPVRKSACDTLLQTIAAHGPALNSNTWSQMISKILFPMLDKVKQLTNGASTQRNSNTTALGASNIMIHHSRDTESKQWAETTVKTLSGVVKIFNSQRAILIGLQNFPEFWSRLLKYIERTTATDNSEMSLAALKNFQELLFGRQQHSDGKEKLSQVTDDLTMTQLPESLWIVSWQTWIQMARFVVSATTTLSDEENPEVSGGVNIALKTTEKKKSYVPGPFHLTTLLNVFIPLFNRIKRQISVDEMRFPNVPAIFQEISTIPLSSNEQQPFVLSAENTELNATQECLLDCLRAIVQEQLDPHSRIRPAIPDMLRLVLSFVQYAIRPPQSRFCAQHNFNDSQNQWAQQNLIAFAELSLRTTVDYYSKVAQYPEVLQEIILVDIVKCLAEPMSLKYHCPNQTTWKISATSLINVCKIGLPIARNNLELFTSLWTELATTIEGFLFSKSKSPQPLNADERKRHEFVDCLLIELIRTEILPYAGILPRDFMQRIIDILNRGSINTLDINDVIALDSFQQRADLSHVCFDALLSMTRAPTTNGISADSSAPDLLKQIRKPGGSLNSSNNNNNGAAESLGSTAIASLLGRCKQVLNNYARDEQGSGHFRLPQERIFEVVSVLRAVSTLIDGLAKQHHTGNNEAQNNSQQCSHSPLYAHLVTLHPCLVQLIPSCRSDQQVELALMTALNSYQTLLLINLHSNPLATNQQQQQQSRNCYKTP